jgi:hypothetical protein
MHASFDEVVNDLANVAAQQRLAPHQTAANHSARVKLIDRREPLLGRQLLSVRLGHVAVHATEVAAIGQAERDGQRMFTADCPSREELREGDGGASGTAPRPRLPRAGTTATLSRFRRPHARHSSIVA